tara:strand:- start:259 stop:384 length:126 start_codon:yes stop_codon:yes gene_type:complete
MATRVVDDAIRDDVWRARFEALSPFSLGREGSAPDTRAARA